MFTQEDYKDVIGSKTHHLNVAATARRMAGQFAAACGVFALACAPAMAQSVSATAKVTPPSTTPAINSQPTPIATNSDSAPTLPSGWHSIREDMQPILTLLYNHSKIDYRIEMVPGGVKTYTTSKDPDLVRVIQLHAKEMKARVEQGNVIRPEDPVFAELFRHHGELIIHMREVPDGVVETETSRNPQVTLLIRAHAKIVAGFVREGLPRTHGPNPLPPGYHASDHASTMSSGKS